MLTVPTLPNAEKEADWAELSCLLNEKSTISRSEIEMILEEGNVDHIERTTGDIWQQINWRHSKADRYHPINAVRGRLLRQRTWKQNLPYTFMLLLSCQSFYPQTKIKPNQWVATSKLFEELITVAMKTYLGYAINIGAPRKNGVPASFDKCLDYICQLTNERKGGRDPLIHWRKDAGVDVISWQPLDDRPSQVIVLVQCAAGGKRWEKAGDINLKKWNKLIDFAADPVKALAFPGIYSTSSAELLDRWLDYSWDGGILFDRLRISCLARMNSKTFKPVKKELADWTYKQIDRVLKNSIS